MVLRNLFLKIWKWGWPERKRGCEKWHPVF